ncbi:MAG: mechanosensitive ion channel [bacterium]|nr:MAG: mechanosensitive ion channel [bacterium]
MKPENIQNLTDLVTANRVFLALLVLAAAWLFLHAFLILSRVLSRRFTRYRMLISSLFPVVRLLVWTGSVAIILFKVFHPPANTVLAVSASAGLAVGLGAQDLIRNIIAGVLILMERPFRVGDMIQVSGEYGEVTAIGLRSIRIQTFDDSSVTIPNAVVASQTVSNSNSGALYEMVVAQFVLPATVDVLRVKQLARDAAASSPYVDLKKPITVLVEDHFEWVFLTRFKVKAYVLDIRYERLFASDIIERVKQASAAEGLLPEQPELPVA